MTARPRGVPRGLELGAVFPDRLGTLIDRVSAYPWWAVAVELVLIWLVVYAVVRFVQGTRAAGASKALLLLVVLATVTVRLAGGEETLRRLGYLYDRALGVFAVALVVIFQPELRRALVRLGETSLFQGRTGQIGSVVSAVVEACGYLAKVRFGAIIVVERGVGLGGLVEGGTRLDAEVSARLIQTVFYPGSALHDLALVIKGERVRAAGVQLPLANPEDMPDPELGSRHRAAVGLTKETDALVVVVSEESGAIRLTQRGILSKPLSPEELSSRLNQALSVRAEAAEGDDEDEGLSGELDDLEPAEDRGGKAREGAA